jgi:azurin
MYRFLAILFLTAPLAGAETFTIKTVPAQMKYDVTEFTVAPGAAVKIVFENLDEMPHNILFFQPGTDVVAVCNQQLEKPEEALKRNWLPEDPRMWMHSRVLNPKERQELVFKAPAKPGIYPYVCSMPGHALIMQGRMEVATPGPKLTGLKFKMYLGDWKLLPEFDQLTPHREGPIPDNLVQIKLDDYKHQFGLVYTARLNAPKDGTYIFYLASDDGARVSVDGEPIVQHNAISPASEIYQGKVSLKTGEHDFRVDYFQAKGGADLFVAWKGPGFGITPLSKWLHKDWRGPGTGTKKKLETTGMPLSVTSEPVIYRNFIEGAGNHGIGVGYPGGFNLAWSAETMNVAMLWRGAFIDAARHWNGRGGGAQPPLGYDLFRPAGEYAPAFAVLSSPGTPWPELTKGERAEGYQWKGYELDARRIPTFHYEWSGLRIADRFEPSGDAKAPEGKLTRMVRLEGSIPAGATFRVATGSILQPENGGFSIQANGARFFVTAEGAQISGPNLLVPARAEMKVTYAWPAVHAH